MQVNMYKLMLIFFLLGATAQADPWYYQTDDALEFWMPDKAQHFYGSQLMTEAGINPLLVFISGIFYELSQSEFSERDVLANILGIIAGQHKITMAVDYSTVREEIVLRMAVKLW